MTLMGMQRTYSANRPYFSPLTLNKFYRKVNIFPNFVTLRGYMYYFTFLSLNPPTKEAHGIYVIIVVARCLKLTV
jgi:hypothetical protein